MPPDQKPKTTFIGLLSAKEDGRRHDELVDLLDGLCAEGNLAARERLSHYSFVMTGGTYKRLVVGDPEEKVKGR